MDDEGLLQGSFSGNGKEGTDLRNIEMKTARAWRLAMDKQGEEKTWISTNRKGKYLGQLHIRASQV